MSKIKNQERKNKKREEGKNEEKATSQLTLYYTLSSRAKPFAKCAFDVKSTKFATAS